MWDTFFAQASRLRAAGEPFALATVVACQRPTAAYPGAKALIRADGTLTGWVGGSCAQPLVSVSWPRSSSSGVAIKPLAKPVPLSRLPIYRRTRQL